MLKALLFDLDGTLVDSDPVHLQTWGLLLEPYGLTVDADFFNQHISGRTNDAILQDLLPHLTAAERLAFAEQKEAQFRQQANPLKSTPGLAGLLSWMEAKGLKRAIVTNAPGKNAHHMLGVLGLAPLFPTVVLGNDLPRSKPDPLPYQTALERLEIQPSEAIAFEDSPTGIQAAVAAGIETVAIASHHTPETLTELGTALVIRDFTDSRLHDRLQTTQTPAYSLV